VLQIIRHHVIDPFCHIRSGKIISTRIQHPAKFWQYFIQTKSHAADLLYAV